MTSSTLFHIMPCVDIIEHAFFFKLVLLLDLFTQTLLFPDIALAYIIKRYTKRLNLKVPQNTRTVSSIFREEVNTDN